MLTTDSAKWTNFKGVYTGVTGVGISHFHEVDAYRRKLSKKKGDGVSDIVDVYKSIVKELYSLGF